MPSLVETEEPEAAATDSAVHSAGPVIPAAGVSESAIDLRELISHREVVNVADSVENVFEVFRHNQLEFLGVVDGERLVGMCSRHSVNTLLGGRYGFSLWARKPIAQHLMPNETRISVATAITDVLKVVFSRSSDQFYDDVLLVGETGGLIGLISTQTLFKVQNALLLGNIKQLRASEWEILQKNQQMESELRMAVELQQAMMPNPSKLFTNRPDGRPEPRFDRRYRPASLVGGDFFHVLKLSDAVSSVFICDVMGHGVRSALVTAMLRALIEACGPDAADPSLLLSHLNSEFTKILKHTDTVAFASAFYCVLDAEQRQVLYARAGHPYPFHMRRKAGAVDRLNCADGVAGPALGLMPSARYGNTRISVDPGDWIFLFTDGIEEAMNDTGVLFGESVLPAVLQANAGMAPGNVLDRVLLEAERFAGGAPLGDDVCLVAAEFPE